MNNFVEFIQKNYNKAITLKEKFKKIENKEWDSLTVLLELIVQTGHCINVLKPDEAINEKDRHINNLGDELSDILLQLSYFSYLEKIEFTNLEQYESYNYNDLTGLIVLLGQTSEALLEKTKYRFDKPRSGFNSKQDFIKDRLIKMFLIIFNFAEANQIKIDKEFDEMIIDASNFIERKILDGNN